jgi:hypothetical protein
MGVRCCQDQGRFRLPRADDTSTIAQGPIHITTNEHITDVLWLTIGPKRPATYRRLQPGIALMMEEVTGHPFGLMLIPGMVHPRAIRLPLWGALTLTDD